MTYSKAASALLFGAAASLLAASGSHASMDEYREANTLVPEGVQRYVATQFPERIVLTPGEQPHQQQFVNWRTNIQVEQSVVELTEAKNTPGLQLTAWTLQGEHRTLQTENGSAHHHSVELNNLKPDTLYAYRVKGENTWSEWSQFRTPKAEFSPYTALYFGDAQNAVKSHFSRVVREAILIAPRASLILHAGDLVNSRNGIHDDEWGEWFEAMNWVGASISQFVVPGNHEFVEKDGKDYLVDHWPAQFQSAGNGPQGLEDTVFYSDYQGVRYISLDSMEALSSDKLAQKQAEWMREVLQNNPNHWTVVVHHHPMYSVSLGRDNATLRKYWLPVYEEFGVDLVLQGHDHTYGRGHEFNGENSSGPVYVVSVAGPKMYLVSEQAEAHMDRNAEDIQLFQTLDFSANELAYNSYTVTGELYDAFTISKPENGVTQIQNRAPETPEVRCQNPNPPRETRCWNGTELIYAPVQGNQ